MRRHIFLILVVVSAMCFEHTSAQEVSKVRIAIEFADSLLRDAVAREHIPGAVLLVARDGMVLHEGAYGYAQLYDYGKERLSTPEPVTPQHLFDLASLTKVFATTFAMMILVDRKLVDLDAPVSRYLPLFSDAHKDSVTVRHLLSHTAGLYQWQPIYYHARNGYEAYRYICSLPLQYPVGKERHYSDLGFMLLGRIVEEISGEPLDSFVSKHLYDPLGLTRTTFKPLDRGFTELVATSHGNPYEKRMISDDNFGYLCHEDPEAFTDWRTYTLKGQVNDGNAYHAFEGVAGHAGLFGTASDLQKLTEILLRSGSDGTRQILRAETVSEFLTMDGHGNGLGWAMSPGFLSVDNLPFGAFGHTGFTGTYAVAVPEESLIIILLTNRQNTGVLPSGHYPSMVPFWKRTAEAIINAAREQGEPGE